MSFRDNLIHLRATHNMTQEQLAMHLGVSRQAVTKWESEKSYPEMDKLLKLCQIFNCTLDELVQGDLTKNQSAQASASTSTTTSSASTKTSVSMPPAPPRPATPPVDVFDYDATMRRFGWKISIGIAAIILGTALALPFFNASDSAANPLFTLPENLAAAFGMIVQFLGILIGLALIIPAGLSHSHFVREHPYIEDFYTKEDKLRARSSFSIQLVGGIACIFAGICSVMLFGEDPENIFGVTIMLSFIALGVFFIVHGAMTLGRTDITQYNQKSSEFLESSEIKNAAIPEPKKQELLQAQKEGKRIGAACGIIMIIATAIALLMLFIPLANGGVDDYTSGSIAFFWLPWPIGGLLCGIVSLLIKGFSKED